MTEYELRSCTVDDADALGKNNASAYWQEEWWNIIWENRSLDSIIKAMSACVPKGLLADRSVRRQQKVVHLPSGDVVGYARWILPESLRDSWLETQTPSVSEDDLAHFAKTHANADFSHRGLDDTDGPIHDMMQRHEPRQPYIRLEYLCSRPDHQRKGVASMLVRSGIQQADSLGADIFLLVMGRNALAMYEKLGFQQLEESIQDLKKWGGQGLCEMVALVKRPYS